MCGVVDWIMMDKVSDHFIESVCALRNTQIRGMEGVVERLLGGMDKRYVERR